VVLNVVAVPATVFALDDVPGFGQVRDDARGAAFGDGEGGRNIAEPHVGITGDAEQRPTMVGQEVPCSHNGTLSVSENKIWKSISGVSLHVFYGGCMVESAPRGIAIENTVGCLGGHRRRRPCLQLGQQVRPPDRLNQRQLDPRPAICRQDASLTDGS